ncbi:tRNA(5-methylaminomethyl-2-thiouridylate)-methyl transferase [Thermocrinis albus DSM 14484]|uniref:tRNA-specific 2-thiouridylase MnmA n=1 Tax=Thermocrinis albus (strain DSM 14484 / JCM 11386 / HI 11/12) TaxID=638303 RepID=D3SMZ4_THEAH|nr:tRNA 2-thiouridine(34) synthase MnmA [Thermocrinis albus]ADC90124.1 tRNA(5-methylaminomethyl-2-thiouridylate)-methyl transferase [Thermocrinis albus DSM 14484]
MRIAVGMSGGVDSSVTALLLKEEGHEVIGVTLRFYKAVCNTEDLRVCCSPQDVKDAVLVSQRLGIPHITLDWEKIFYERVIKYFVEGYKEGITPNPCAVCNREVKTGFLARYLRNVALIDRLATGHYVRKIQYMGYSLLARGKDTTRDQSYFMALVRGEDIPLLEFPLGDKTKEEVRKIAEEKGLPTARKRDSQEVCFLMGRSPGEYMKDILGEREGPIVYKGKVVGKHRGYYAYTVGQRRGLSVALGKPVYVTGIDPITNTVFVGDEEELYKDWLLLEDINFHLPMHLWSRPAVQTRYRSKTVEVRDIEKLPNGYKVYLKEPVRAITPGQVCAFYEGDVLLGGGIIRI